ncbi:hypothetical protein EDC04DRAFT_954505 [Pisolithus marmoratus]|nr:hypothetical protein EDC04DRAFT_954505 [Pisolithus marmoratus]
MFTNTPTQRVVYDPPRQRYRHGRMTLGDTIRRHLVSDQTSSRTGYDSNHLSGYDSLLLQPARLGRRRMIPMHIRNNVHPLRIRDAWPELRLGHGHGFGVVPPSRRICRDATTAHPTVIHTCLSATAGTRVAILFASSHSPCKMRHPIWDFHDTRFWTFPAPGDEMWSCFGTSCKFAGTAVDASSGKLDDTTAEPKPRLLGGHNTPFLILNNLIHHSISRDRVGGHLASAAGVGGNS